MLIEVATESPCWFVKAKHLVQATPIWGPQHSRTHPQPRTETVNLVFPGGGSGLFVASRLAYFGSFPFALEFLINRLSVGDMSYL
jgi:hypothetical protein